MSKSSIMHQAWSLYREITTAAPECRSRAQFGLCLRAVWEQANAARTARRQWQTMDGPQQFVALTRMAWTVKRRAEATGRVADTEWITTPDDAQTIAADAWPRVAPALDRNDQREDPRPLAHILFAACSQAAHSIARAEYRHASACCQIAAIDTDGDAADQTPLDILPSVTAAPVSDPEDAAIIRAAIEAAAADNTDRQIIQALVVGLTVRQIAAALDLSKSAVQRRIDSIRSRYHAA